MSHHRTTTFRIATVWAGIAAAGALAGWAGHQARLDHLRDDLRRDARRLAVAFEAAELRALTGAPGDRATPAHAAVAQRLQKLRSVYPEARYIAVVRWQPDAGRAVPLVDSAAGGARPLPADFLDADRTTRLAEAVRLGEPAAEPPRSAGPGRWVTTYAPLASPAAGGPGRGHDVLVLDVDAGDWPAAAWETAFRAAFYTWVVLGLPFLAFLVARRQGEQREVIRNLTEAMEQSHSAILIVDLHGMIEYVNRGMCEQIGYARRDVIGRDWRELGLAPAPDAAHAEVMAVVRAGRPWEGEWSHRRKDGSTYPVRGVVTPVKDRRGSLACHVVVVDDVTETKRREAELREARDRAEAGDRAKGHFLATMSHEVRTPLNGIVGFTSLLLETPLSAEQRDYVQTIRMSTEALIQLTGDILDFARIESGKLKLEPLPCDPRECIEDALDLLAAKAAEKQVELLHRAAHDVPAAVLTDGGRLRQVLVNLVGNAVKFTEKGEVTVAVRLLPGGAAAAGPGPTVPEGVLEFSVRDTGIGIDPRQHPRLFKAFSQVDDSTTRRYSGTGLGLAISRNLVRLMGGDISVASEPGRGAEFRFTIAAPFVAPEPPNRNLAGLPVALVARPGVLRDELARLLAGWHAQVIEAAGTAELAAGGWQAAIIDLDEPLARHLAESSEPLPAVRPDSAIALVPMTLSSDLRGGLRAHFRSLLNKPVHHEALFSLLTGARSEGPFAPVPPTHFGFRVLLVADNPIDQRMLQRVLANLGCSWHTVENGETAVAALTQRADDYDLILLDLRMPESDALSALAKIRDGAAGTRARTMWVIVLAASAAEEQAARAQSAGWNDFLIHPAGLAEVEAALKRFRTERRSRQR